MKLRNMMRSERISLFQTIRFATLSGGLMWSVVAWLGWAFPAESIPWSYFGTALVFLFNGLLLMRAGKNISPGHKEIKQDLPVKLHFYLLAQVILTFAIAIPFFLEEPTSLPLTMGILTGTIWFPYSWIFNHWMGYLHVILRTVSISVLWQLYPAQGYILIPVAIALIYFLTQLFFMYSTKSKPVLRIIE